MNTDCEYTGPATPLPRQVPAVLELVNAVFRSEGTGDMGREYPLLFHGDRLEQMRTFFLGERCVAHVGVVIDETVLLGCPLKTAFIGAVCTHPDHRGKGLASRLMRDATAHAARCGASIMLISGGRSLYNRHGAYPAGRFVTYALPADALPNDPELTVVEPPATVGGARSVLRFYEPEPIRFRNAPDDFAALMACGLLMNRPGMTCLVHRGDRPVATMCVNAPSEDSFYGGEVAVVRQLAGDRSAVLAALRPVAERMGAGRVLIDAYPCDAALSETCVPRGAEVNERTFYGTVKVIDPERLWSDVRPLLAERLGRQALGRLQLEWRTDRLAAGALEIAYGDERLDVDGPEDILRLLFGHPLHDVTAQVPGELGEVLRTALPLPLPLPGMNFV